MAYPFRHKNPSAATINLSNHGGGFQSVLDVMPLNSMPYEGPPLPHCSTAPFPVEVNTKPVDDPGPAMVYLPSCPASEDWCRIVDFTKHGVGLTGSAVGGRVGPIVGLMDIGECADSYLFRVSLPGVAREENKFQFDIQPDGKIQINGVTTTGEKIVCSHSQVFVMSTRNLCPPGRFTVTFQLPGPVDSQHLFASFGTDGIFEGTVKKG